MYAKNKFEGGRQGRAGGAAGQNQTNSGALCMRSPGDWSQGQTYYWRGSRFATAVSEPENDEAFVEESGIKVVESSCEKGTEGSDRDEDDDGDEDQDEEEEEDDPLYSLEVMDDTIVEEAEDDADEEDEGEDSDEEKASGGVNGTKSAEEPPKNGKDQAPPSAFTSSAPPPPSSLPMPQPDWVRPENEDSTNKPEARSRPAINGEVPLGDRPPNKAPQVCTQSSVFTPIPAKPAAALPPKSANLVLPRSESQPSSFVSVPFGAGSIPSSSSAPSPIFALSTICSPMMLATTTTSGPQKGQGGGSNSRPSSRPSSRSNSPLAFGLGGWGEPLSGDAAPVPSFKGNQPGLFAQAFQLGVGGRGRANRLNLPLTRINAPRHKFTIRRVNESEAPTKRSYGTAEPRSAQDVSRVAGKATPSPVWLRKHQVRGSLPSLLLKDVTVTWIHF